MNTDRKTVRKGIAKIMKLKVAQDTAYFDLKEKLLDQMKNNYELSYGKRVDAKLKYFRRILTSTETHAANFNTKEKLEENEDLKRAVRMQVELAKSLCDQKNQLQEKICSMEQQQQATLKMFKELETKYQRAISEFDILKEELVALNQTKEELQRFMGGQDQLGACTTKAEIDNLKAELTTLKVEKLKIMDDLNHKIEESNEKTVQIENLTAVTQGLEMRVRDMDESMKYLKNTTDTQIKELKHTIQIKDNELDSKASTITQLISDMKKGTDARSKLEGIAQRLKREQDEERITANEKEGKLAKQIEKLEISVRNKPEELSKQMFIILNLTNEKEKLEDKIQAMENKIDKEQELSGPREQPVLHDSAAGLTPARKRTVVMPQPASKHQKRIKFLRVEPAQREDRAPLDTCSDRSTDGDVTDMAEVNRRFESMVRGETFTPVPLSALKRRREKLPATYAGNVSPILNNPIASNPTSLSQLKDEINNKGQMFFKNK